MKEKPMPNNCKSPEMCLLSETCVPCAICPNAKEKANNRLDLTACSRSLTPRTDAEIATYFRNDDGISLIHLKDHARNLERELNEATERIGHAETILSDLASGYWRSVLNEQNPSGEGCMGERVIQYWAQYSENAKSAGTDASEKTL